ncbi:MAG: SDR family oxidoreductase [Pirellulaceae bacterium]|nr:SDR family oxidoreductase [Pirellulaceae bacterium]
MDLGLQNQLAIVVGGARGIGLATAQLLLEEGAKVELWDYAQSVHQTAEELQASFPNRVSARQVNIVDAEACTSAVEAAAGAHGRIDHLILAAAIGSGKFGFPFTNLKPADWHRVIEVNILGTANIAHAIAPRLIEQRSGTLTLLGSVAGQIGSQTDPPYSASKAANINFMQCMAKDLAPYDVRVNLINPGMVQTDLNRSVWQGWHDQQPIDQRRSYEDWAGEKVRKVIPLGRWQTAEDIANVIAFLISPRARNITGQAINVDGGFVMHC